MRIHSFLLPVTIELPAASYRFSTTVTVVQTSSELLVVDTGFPDTGLEEEFHRAGLNPDDVTMVANTHFHVDHFGGNRLFANARILMSREEYHYQLAWHRTYLEAGDKKALVAASFPRLAERQVGKLVRFLDVVKSRYFKDTYFGDMHQAVYIEDKPALPDWLRVMHTPGHTPHHVSYVLQGLRGGAIVTGDIIAGRNAYMNGKVNFIEVYTDYDEALKSIESLKAVAGIWPHTVICPSHEMPFYAADGAHVQEFPFDIV
jgi:glyoxylase-like metal-dependent hydrolase (beta-lactamase superfamily II)